MLSHPGEIAALSAALIWAIASFIYVHLGRQMPPLVLNLAKSGIAIGLVGLTLWLQGSPAPQLSGDLGLLLLSGAIGIGFGDTAFFESLNYLGARRALLIESLAPPLAALLAAGFLGEQLGGQAWLGISLTVAGVAWVVVERAPPAVVAKTPPQTERSESFQRKERLGVGFGLLAALGQAGGAVLSRAALAETAVSPLWSTLLRLVAGVLVLGMMILWQRRTWVGFQPVRSPRFLGVLLATSFFGTYLAIWLQQTALKYTATGIAQALTSTSPLFVLPIAALLKESISVRAVLGVLVALGGIWLLLDL